MPSAAARSSDGPPDAGQSASTTASSTGASAAAAASSPSPGRQSPKARPRPRPLNQQHHPYRIELLDLTPVSVSQLWSTRPPPLSAIPLEVINSQLRKRIKGRSAGSSAVRSSSPHQTSARATAVSPSPTSATAAASSKSRATAGNQTSDRHTAGPSHSQHETPVSKLIDGLVATRSLNRKVTKIRLRAPPTVAAQPRRSSNGSAPSDSAHNSTNDDDAWPSDDGATPAEDEAGSASDASDSGYEGGPDARHHVTSVFKDRVSVTVNGQDWSHVLMGERGSHEAIVVIFGLEPESDYDIQFLVKAGLDGTHDVFRASLRTRSERESRSLDSASHNIVSSGAMAVRPASPSPLGRLPLSAPEIDITDVVPQRLAVLQAELEASEALKASLIADVKKARKESSKQEAALRQEIDAVKRAMDRMSATDHRSRQKVLALQELIKQTTIHTKEIHEQAEVTEKEQPEWEEQDAKLEAEVEVLRKEVEAEEAAAQAEWDKNDAAVAALEKELKALKTTAKALESERDELRDDKLTSIRAEIERVKEQAKEALSRPPGAHARRGGAAAGGGRGGHRHASGPHIASGGPGNKGKQQGRGGKMFGNRAVSGPASQFGGPGNNSSSGGFAGASRNFMQNFGKGFRRNQNHNQTASFDSANAAGFTGSGGAGQMLPPGSGYGGMQDPAMGIGAYGANPPYGQIESYYGEQHQTPSFPSSLSEVSQDDLYDPTLGFDPYDPSIDARRRSSLPIEPMPYQQAASKLPASTTSTALNPANPEFVPSTGSNHASPVISKNASASEAPTSTATTSAALPAHAAIATQSPPAGVASVEHSPTSSSRFAFPLARHVPTVASVSSSLAHKSSSSALAASVNAASSNPNNVLNLGSDLNVPASSGMGSSLFSMGASGTASPFARHSPLIPQGIESSAAPSAFGNASPRFGAMGLHSHHASSNSEDAVNSALSSGPFGGSSKFGPLDYDPTMDSFGPAPGLSSGLGPPSGPGANASGLPSFSSSTMSSIFGASDAWSSPGLPVTSGLGGSSTAIGAPSWITSSPPLGPGTTTAAGGGGDIWSAPTLSGVSQLRGKLSMSDLAGVSNSSPSSSPMTSNATPSTGAFGGFGGGRMGLGAIGQASGIAAGSVPSKSSPLASPSAASPVPPTDASKEQTESGAAGEAQVGKDDKEESE